MLVDIIKKGETLDRVPPSRQTKTTSITSSYKIIKKYSIHF